MSVVQTLVNNANVNANAGGTFNGDFPAGTVAVKLELSATYTGPAGGELDFDATMFDSDDAVAWREIGVSSGSGGPNSGQTFVSTGVKPHWRVVFQNRSRMRLTLVATFFQPGEQIV